MKLEDKFFNAFFYPFLTGVILSTLVVTIFLGIFTNSYNDKRTTQNIINLETKFAKTNIKSVNIILSTILLKVQASINEQILFYLRIANKTKDIKDIYELKLHDSKFKSVYDLDDNYLKEHENDLQYMAYWYIDNTIKTFEDIDDITAQKQIIALSHIMPNLYSTFESTSRMNSIFDYYFYFEETNLFMSFPVKYDYDNGYLEVYQLYEENPYWCTDEEGEVLKTYNLKCRDFYTNIQKAKSEIFDNNYMNDKNRTIFVTNFYTQLDDGGSGFVYTVCIRFLDPISNGNGYACTDVSQNDLISAFDNLNTKLIGYYFISSVGFNNVFFFPQGNDNPKTMTENIYRWDVDFILEEKTYFFKKIQKILTSNYINQIGNDLYEEVFVNGQNSSEQIFYIKNKKHNYSIFPVILNNLLGEKEHVLSIIYIYNTNAYMSNLTINDSSFVIKIILELIIFIIFGWGLLHIIILMFNTLVKYIVIPIKNINYMLKGINIGGRNRINYLDYLKKRQDDNLEKLEKMYKLEVKKNDLNEHFSSGKEDKDNYNNTETQENNMIINLAQNDIKNTDTNINRFKKNKNDDYNKTYDEESHYIEKEWSFYDFDEALLQFRPLEIENLVKLLLDIKSALILTSSDQSVDQIIDYSNSEDIFRNFKNKEGTSICQSNIGNLQIQLQKFDKAIYHLAISLQDNKLKRFLSRTLNDELDEGNSLLNRISNSFNKKKKKEKTNKLMEKQQSNISDNFSQKIIGILINTRYTRLIYAYYKFFKGMKKLKKKNNDDINGQFMNTYFHNINFYHKTIIQYIYLSYVKNDLIKIGESILDYIEFLIEFKFKTSSDEKHILNVKYNDNPEYQKKQKIKKKIFQKIMSWFNLFDDYVSYVKDNTSLGDDKNIINDYYLSLNNTENKDFDKGSQSVFLFRINIQRGDFLKGKFALCCKNYNDALFYFIRSSKKKSIVSDGLIKKKSLLKIFKIMEKLKQKINNYQMMNFNLKEKLSELMKTKHKLGNKKIFNNIKKIEDIHINEKYNTFHELVVIINNKIIKDIIECNAKEAKDIIILIDFNIYNKLENNDLINDKIEGFIAETKTILNNYLSTKDRFAAFIYRKQYQIICPLMYKYQIDIKSFSKDLLFFKTKIINEKENDEYDIDLEDFQNKNIEFELGGKTFDENSQEEESSESNNKTEEFYNKIEGLIEAINYINNYIQMKESTNNEKYFILFTDLFNAELSNDEKMKKIFSKIKENKEVIFLLVGKNKKFKHQSEKGSDIIEDDKCMINYVINKFGQKSEMIHFENMNNIKTILSLNNVIKDEIIYPNEIYK